MQRWLNPDMALEIDLLQIRASAKDDAQRLNIMLPYKYYRKLEY